MTDSSASTEQSASQLNSQLYCALYRSLGSSDFIAERDLLSLTQAAQNYNDRRQITGMLLYTGDRFVQYLEGARVDILTLIEKIRADSRHSQVQILAMHPIGRRHYGAWSMESFNLRETAVAAAARFDNLERSYQQLRATQITLSDGTEVPSDTALQLLATFMTPPEFN